MKNRKINFTNALRMAFRVAMAVGLILIVNVKAEAQLSFTAGGNYSTVRDNGLLENTKAIAGYSFGASIQYHPFKKIDNVSVINELNYTRKGYQQDLDKNYSVRFNYLAFPILIDYAPLKDFSVQGGVELSTLVSTNIEQGKDIYNNFDVGLVLGLSCFQDKKISCFSRITYGLMPMLDYYRIDELGNFTEEIHDVKNVCLSIGIKFNFYNEKIYLHK